MKNNNCECVSNTGDGFRGAGLTIEEADRITPIADPASSRRQLYSRMHLDSSMRHLLVDPLAQGAAQTTLIQNTRR